MFSVDTEKTLVKALLNHIRKQSLKPEGKTNSLLEFNMLKKDGRDIWKIFKEHACIFDDIKPKSGET